MRLSAPFCSRSEHTPVIAALLGGHLLGIALTVGGAIGVRDATLAVTTLSLALAPVDPLSIDAREAAHRTAKQPSAWTPE